MSTHDLHNEGVEIMQRNKTLFAHRLAKSPTLLGSLNGFFGPFALIFRQL